MEAKNIGDAIIIQSKEMKAHFGTKLMTVDNLIEFLEGKMAEYDSRGFIPTLDLVIEDLKREHVTASA